jgi:hypothetical protein
MGKWSEDMTTCEKVNRELVRGHIYDKVISTVAKSKPSVFVMNEFDDFISSHVLLPCEIKPANFTRDVIERIKDEGQCNEPVRMRNIIVDWYTGINLDNQWLKVLSWYLDENKKSILNHVKEVQAGKFDDYYDAKEKQLMQKALNGWVYEPFAESANGEIILGYTTEPFTGMNGLGIKYIPDTCVSVRIHLLTLFMMMDECLELGNDLNWFRESCSFAFGYAGAASKVLNTAFGLYKTVIGALSDDECINWNADAPNFQGGKKNDRAYYATVKDLLEEGFTDEFIKYCPLTIEYLRTLPYQSIENPKKGLNIAMNIPVIFGFLRTDQYLTAQKTYEIVDEWFGNPNEQFLTMLRAEVVRTMVPVWTGSGNNRDYPTNDEYKREIYNAMSSRSTGGDPNKMWYQFSGNKDRSTLSSEDVANVTMISDPERLAKLNKNNPKLYAEWILSDKKLALPPGTKWTTKWMKDNGWRKFSSTAKSFNSMVNSLNEYYTPELARETGKSIEMRVGTRYQSGKDSRSIFMSGREFPLFWVIMRGLQYQHNDDPMMTVGKTKGGLYDARITAELTGMLNMLISGMDMTSYDYSQQKPIMHAMFDGLRQVIGMVSLDLDMERHLEFDGRKYSPTEVMNALQDSIDDRQIIINGKKLVVSVLGKEVDKFTFLFSGLWVTLAWNSITNATMQKYVIMRFQQEQPHVFEQLQEVLRQIMGDDALSGYQCYSVTPELIHQLRDGIVKYASECGLKINGKKTLISTKVAEYLKRIAINGVVVPRPSPFSGERNTFSASPLARMNALGAKIGTLATRTWKTTSLSTYLIMLWCGMRQVFARGKDRAGQYLPLDIIFAPVSLGGCGINPFNPLSLGGLPVSPKTISLLQLMRSERTESMVMAARKAPIFSKGRDYLNKYVLNAGRVNRAGPLSENMVGALHIGRTFERKARNVFQALKLIDQNEAKYNAMLRGDLSTNPSELPGEPGTPLIDVDWGVNVTYGELVDQKYKWCPIMGLDDYFSTWVNCCGVSLRATPYSDYLDRAYSIIKRDRYAPPELDAGAVISLLLAHDRVTRLVMMRQMGLGDTSMSALASLMDMHELELRMAMVDSYAGSKSDATSFIDMSHTNITNLIKVELTGVSITDAHMLSVGMVMFMRQPITRRPRVVHVSIKSQDAFQKVIKVLPSPFRDRAEYIYSYMNT